MEQFKRDYKSEWKKEKETKTSRLLKIDKKLNEEFSKKLKNDNLSYSEFVHNCIYRYLNNKLNLD